MSSLRTCSIRQPAFPGISEPSGCAGTAVAFVYVTRADVMSRAGRARSSCQLMAAPPVRPVGMSRRLEPSGDLGGRRATSGDGGPGHPEFQERLVTGRGAAVGTPEFRFVYQGERR